MDDTDDTFARWLGYYAQGVLSLGFEEVSE